MNLYKKIEVRLTAEESYHALCNIVLILCQQADFKNFTAAKTVRRGGLEHPRYLPGKFNYETNDPTIQHYLYDVIKLRQLGFQRAGYVAAYHSPEFCSEMIDHFFGFEDMNRSLITQVIGNNLANPLPALERFMRRLTEVTEAFPATRHTNRTRWAMGSKGLDELKDPPIRKKKIYEIINDSRLT